MGKFFRNVSPEKKSSKQSIFRFLNVKWCEYITQNVNFQLEKILKKLTKTIKKFNTRKCIFQNCIKAKTR